MVLVLTSTLLFSIFGLVVLFGVKYWEDKTGRFVGARVRPKVSNFFHTGLVWVEHIFPVLVRTHGRTAIAHSASALYKGVAYIVLHTEHYLEHFLHALRHTTDARAVQPKGFGEPSVFLREVAEHKRKLLHSSVVTKGTPE